MAHIKLHTHWTRRLENRRYAVSRAPRTCRVAGNRFFLVVAFQQLTRQFADVARFCKVIAVCVRLCVCVSALSTRSDDRECSIELQRDDLGTIRNQEFFVLLIVDIYAHENHYSLN